MSPSSESSQNGLTHTLRWNTSRGVLGELVGHLLVRQFEVAHEMRHPTAAVLDADETQAEAGQRAVADRRRQRVLDRSTVVGDGRERHGFGRDELTVARTLHVLRYCWYPVSEA